MSERLGGLDNIIDGLRLKQQAIEDLKRNNFSPEAYTNYWQGEFHSKDFNVHVPDCNWTEEEIAMPMKDTDSKETQGVMIYLPEELTEKEGLTRLVEMYPQAKGHSFDESTRIRDTHKAVGWIKGYATSDAPNLDTTEKQLEDFAKQQGYLGGRVRSYILISQFMKNLTGQYQYTDKVFRLLGSSHGYGGSMVIAHFSLDGNLDTNWALFPEHHREFVGGWLEQIKKNLGVTLEENHRDNSI